MKAFLLKVWEKIKDERGLLFIYALSVAVTIISDVIFGGFNIFKYIAYIALTIGLIAVLIIYKDKIAQAVDTVVDKVDEKINS